MKRFIPGIMALVTLSLTAVSSLDICENVSNDTFGDHTCVARNYVDHSKVFIVDDTDDVESHGDPLKCIKACRKDHPNAILALVRLNEEKGLDCSCAMKDAVTKTGPTIFCNRKCPKSGEHFCGGRNLFANGTTLDYWSVFCIHTLNPENRAPKLPSNKNGDIYDSQDEEELREINAILERIWLSLISSNIMSIILITLLVVLIILILVLMVWTYLFIENYDPAAKSLFYRNLSSIRGRPSQVHDQQQPQSSTYGAMNHGFEHSPDDPVPPIEMEQKQVDSSETGMDGPEGPDPNARNSGPKSTFYYGTLNSSQESVETEPSDGAIVSEKSPKSN